MHICCQAVLPRLPPPRGTLAGLCPELGFRKLPPNCSEASGVRLGRRHGSLGPGRCWDSVVSRSVPPDLSRALRLPSDGSKDFGRRTVSPESTGVSSRPARSPLPSSASSSFSRPPAPLPSQPLPRHDPQSLTLPPPARPGRVLGPRQPVLSVPRSVVLVRRWGCRLIYGVSGSRMWDCLLAFKLIMSQIPPAQLEPSANDY